MALICSVLWHRTLQSLVPPLVNEVISCASLQILCVCVCLSLNIGFSFLEEEPNESLSSPVRLLVKRPLPTFGPPGRLMWRGKTRPTESPSTCGASGKETGSERKLCKGKNVCNKSASSNFNLIPSHCFIVFTITPPFSFLLFSFLFLQPVSSVYSVCSL